MPPVTRLPVHLENQQNVFSDDNNLDDPAARRQLQMNAERSCRSHLKQWLELNKHESLLSMVFKYCLPPSDLLYTEIPTYYRWEVETRE